MTTNSSENIHDYVTVASNVYTVHIINCHHAKAGAVIPLLLNELENLIIAHDCIHVVLPEFQDPFSVKTALAMSNTLASENYERLEIFGDRYYHNKIFKLFFILLELHFFLFFFEIFNIVY